MARTRVESPGAPAAIGPYSQAIRTGEWVFLSGQIGLDPNSGTLVSGGVEAQTERVLDNIAAVLAASGATLGDVVRTTVYLVSIDDFAVVNEVYARRVHEPYPARVTVGVSALPKGALIEIEAVARIE